MSSPHPVYRSLLVLYPREFRREYGPDLVQQHADLVHDRGARAAWTRTGLDLLVTVPRYRLERIMSEQKRATTIHVGIALIAAVGVVSVATGLYPGAALLVLAVALAVAQRSSLAKAIRTPDSDRRRHRLQIGAVLAAVCAASYLTFLAVIGDRWTTRETLLSLIGIPSMFGAIGFLVIGFLTPKATETQPRPV